MRRTTNYQAKYFAYALTREGGQGVERLQQLLLNATVDLNPHQVEAALFALRSPISSGALLADEVGLGKTIEAGLVMCQLWAGETPISPYDFRQRSNTRKTPCGGCALF